MSRNINAYQKVYDLGESWMIMPNGNKKISIRGKDFGADGKEVYIKRLLSGKKISHEEIQSQGRNVYYIPSGLEGRYQKYLEKCFYFDLNSEEYKHLKNEEVTLVKYNIGTKTRGFRDHELMVGIDYLGPAEAIYDLRNQSGINLIKVVSVDLDNNGSYTSDYDFYVDLVVPEELKEGSTLTVNNPINSYKIVANNEDYILELKVANGLSVDDFISSQPKGGNERYKNGRFKKYPVAIYKKEKDTIQWYIKGDSSEPFYFDLVCFKEDISNISNFGTLRMIKTSEQIPTIPMSNLANYYIEAPIHLNKRANSFYIDGIKKKLDCTLTVSINDKNATVEGNIVSTSANSNGASNLAFVLNSKNMKFDRSLSFNGKDNVGYLYLYSDKEVEATIQIKVKDEIKWDDTKKGYYRESDGKNVVFDPGNNEAVQLVDYLSAMIATWEFSYEDQKVHLIVQEPEENQMSEFTLEIYDSNDELSQYYKGKFKDGTEKLIIEFNEAKISIFMKAFATDQSYCDIMIEKENSKPQQVRGKVLKK